MNLMLSKAIPQYDRKSMFNKRICLSELCRDYRGEEFSSVLSAVLARRLFFCGWWQYKLDLTRLVECCWIWVVFSQREGGVRHPRLLLVEFESLLSEDLQMSRSVLFSLFLFTAIGAVIGSQLETVADFGWDSQPTGIAVSEVRLFFN